MIVDGKKISEEMQTKLKKQFSRLLSRPVFVVFSAGQNPANTSFIEKKKNFAEKVGVELKDVKLSESSTLLAKKDIAQTLKKEKPIAAIIQIPLPKNLDADVLLNTLQHELDVDALASGNTMFLSPIVLSIQEILSRYRVAVRGKNVVLVGAGKLVGQPAAEFFKQKRAKVTVCDKFTKNISKYTKQADILVTGAGAAHIIKSNMVKNGVVAIDVGFSRKHGKVVGDIHPEVANKAKVFSGVPGGIGSMTVAYLFSNVLRAAKLQNKAKN